ncbi:hypothetical protein F4781DRAFT_433722 [Annulohypoxylon bovei var. microspora]|nr:hypothetical protein F4781DRAFT_433722 [Annulohypoxylon bovei var. microspora]
MPLFPFIFTAVCLVPALVIGVSIFWKGAETSAHHCFMTGLRFFAIGFGYMGCWSTACRIRARKEERDVEIEVAEQVLTAEAEAENGVAIDGGNVTALGWERRASVTSSDVSELDLGDIRDILDPEVTGVEDGDWC